MAMGLMHQPRLLFLDEPTTGLDPQSRARIWDEMRRLRAEGVTISLDEPTDWSRWDPARRRWTP